MQLEKLILNNATNKKCGMAYKVMIWNGASLLKVTGEVPLSTESSVSAVKLSSDFSVTSDNVSENGIIHLFRGVEQIGNNWELFVLAPSL